jgi:hypothetical protein
MYSWLTAVKGDGLKVKDPTDEDDEDDEDGVMKEGVLWKPLMTLEEIDSTYGKSRVVELPVTHASDLAK